MVERGEVNLGGDILPIAGVASLLAVGEELLTADVAGAGITALNHKILDDAVEQKRVEIALLHKLHKVIAVDRRQVAKLQDDVASRSAHLHAAGLGSLLGTRHKRNGCHKGEKYLFHLPSVCRLLTC